MIKKLLLASLILTNTVWAYVPEVECRFAALTEDRDVGFDEVVRFPLISGNEIFGDFEPYEFELITTFDSLIVSTVLDGELLDELEIPAGYILNLPLGASIFGVETIRHDLVDDFVALRYECIRVL